MEDAEGTAIEKALRKLRGLMGMGVTSGTLGSAGARRAALQEPKEPLLLGSELE